MFCFDPGSMSICVLCLPVFFTVDPLEFGVAYIRYLTVCVKSPRT